MPITLEELEQRLKSDVTVEGRRKQNLLWRQLIEQLDFNRPPTFALTSDWIPPVQTKVVDEVIKVCWENSSFEVYLPKASRTSGRNHRIFVVATALSVAVRLQPLLSGSVSFSLSDHGHCDALSMCANDPSTILFPDVEFFDSIGYERFREEVERRAAPWRERKVEVLWRGTGLGPIAPPAADGDWAWLPRAHLCHRAAELSSDYPLDVKLTKIFPGLLKRHGSRLSGLNQFFGNQIEPIGFANSRFLIDIDGWSNSWSGLFRKLLTGSTVLKVASPRGFRQWYYDRLRPWVHYVPVKSDLSDLKEVLGLVLADDEMSEEIGARGRALALSITPQEGLMTLAQAVREFVVRAPEDQQNSSDEEPSVVPSD